MFIAVSSTVIYSSSFQFRTTTADASFMSTQVQQGERNNKGKLGSPWFRFQRRNYQLKRVSCNYIIAVVGFIRHTVTMVGDSRWFNRRALPLLVVFIFYALFTSSYYLGYYVSWASLISTGHSTYPRNQSTYTRPTSPFKRIFLWNSPHRIEASAFGTGHRVFVDAKCPVTDCLIIANSSDFWKMILESEFQLLKDFDAVLFNVHELWLSSLPPQWYRKPPYQRFVFFTQESPQSMTALEPEKFDNFFNWTMTYRLDSDVQLLYGRLHSISNKTIIHEHINQSEKLKHKRSKKTKKIAWMVSHCNTASKREEYVRQLQEYIPVDIYGGCGTFKCARNDTHWLSSPECYVQLAKEYKFYLSFENSLCYDYVTEKFFSVLQHDLLPVVLGAADYSLIAPPYSYIDVAQFSSPADLAAYLLKLDSDDELYERYFDWKSQYIVEAGASQMSRHAFCDLCAKLHMNETSKSYASIVNKWSPTNQCYN